MPRRRLVGGADEEADDEADSVADGGPSGTRDMGDTV